MALTNPLPAPDVIYCKKKNNCVGVLFAVISVREAQPTPVSPRSQRNRLFISEDGGPGVNQLANCGFNWMQ